MQTGVAVLQQPSEFLSLTSCIQYENGYSQAVTKQWKENRRIMPSKKDIGSETITRSELAHIADQVCRNCDISDAKNAGLYSICGLALRLRDLFKWEKGLPPWVEKDSSEILEWIGVREERWERLGGDSFSSIALNGEQFDPFDTVGINIRLEPLGYYYGAGYAHGLKPTFFLARLEKKESIAGIEVISLGKELARDLLTIPAMSQDRCVILRQDAARLHLWDKMFYLKKSARPALEFALESCGLREESSDGLQQKLEAVCNAHRGNYIYHEVGEMRDTVFERQEWREMIARYPHSPTELLIRSVKDILADTNRYGTLQHIVTERNHAALGLYVAFIDGLAKEIFSELMPAFQNFMLTGDWQLIHDTVEKAHRQACRMAEQIVFLYRDGKKKNRPQQARCAIEQQVLGSIIRQP